MRDILTDLVDKQNDPVRAAQKKMRAPLPKRFYETVCVDEVRAVADQAEFRVLLDGRAVKTPGKVAISLASRAHADRLAGEFEAQKTEINPADMLFYRLINTAIDGVARDMQAVREDIVRFAGSDLLCYRAQTPQGLADSQAEHWDDMLDWAGRACGQAFIRVEGVMHVHQPRAALSGFNVLVGQIDTPLALAALHSMTSLTGSAILALGVAKAHITASDAWAAAHVDEDWNIAQWGEDAEAKARRSARWREMEAAALVFDA